jgi:plastocyanin
MSGNRMKRAALLVIALVSIFCAARALGTENEPATVTVAIDNFSFTPKEVTIEKGTTVTWVNHDDVPHTVVSTAQKFRSKALDTDDKYSFTFTDTGTFGYFCSVHPVMTGKITVR